ncbi:alpha/beta fold hydrolase [Carnobacteriaceae bacterium zg-C25]|nr:alpha/beta fold hydrolase [Carnobacteriaceae bacterium zg-C25]
MQTVMLEGTNGRALILLHAYTSFYVDVQLIGIELNKLGYTVCMPTLPGHGTRDMQNILKYNMFDYRDAIKDEIHQLNDKGYDEIAIFGLSLGGVLALDILTQKIPGIVGGGSFNSPIPLSDSQPIVNQFVTYANSMYQQVFGEKQVYLERMRQGATHHLEAMATLSYDVHGNLNNIDVPVFIAQSLKDELIPIDTGERLAKSIHFTSVELHTFENGKHAITVGPYRKELLQKLTAFIETLDWS